MLLESLKLYDTSVNSREDQENTVVLTIVFVDLSFQVWPAMVCFDDEFVIGDVCQGTCVYIGLLDDGSELHWN